MQKRFIVAAELALPVDVKEIKYKTGETSFAAKSRNKNRIVFC